MGDDPTVDNAQPPVGANMDEVLERFRGASHVDYAKFRADLDRYVSQDPTPRTAGKRREPTDL